MRHYCTYFDRNFLVRGLTLYRSLREHEDAFTLWVLCLDDVTYDSLVTLDAPGLEPIRLADLEAAFPELLPAKSNRSRIEYFFTCSPALPRYILNVEPEIDIITYLDADLYFFASPAPLFEEMQDKSILIIEHRFHVTLRHLEQYGRFNVGFLSFRNDDAGRACLDHWRQQCIAWCYDRVEDGKFADQKYLDSWPDQFPSTGILQHTGANVAPWNVAFHRIRQTITGETGVTGVTIDGVPLIFYHFHRLRILNRWICDPGLLHYQRFPASRALRESIYKPYLRALGETWEWVRTRTKGLEPGYVQAQARYASASLVRDAVQSFLRGQLLISLRGFR